MSQRNLWVPLIGLVIAALACGGGSSGGDDGPRETPTPRPLFEDDFSKSNSGWTTDSDETASKDYEDGEYVFRVTDTGWFVWGNPDKSFSDVHIEVTAKNTGTASNNKFGIICHYDDDARNYYYMGIGSNGFYAIVRSDNNEDTYLSNDEDLWIESEAIPQNADSYRIGADCANGKLALYVDDTLIASADDATYSSGDVGLFAFTFDEADAEVRFDDFVVTSLK